MGLLQPPAQRYLDIYSIIKTLTETLVLYIEPALLGSPFRMLCFISVSEYSEQLHDKKGR